MWTSYVQSQYTCPYHAEHTEQTAQSSHSCCQNIKRKWVTVYCIFMYSDTHFCKLIQINLIPQRVNIFFSQNINTWVTLWAYQYFFFFSFHIFSMRFNTHIQCNNTYLLRKFFISVAAHSRYPVPWTVELERSSIFLLHDMIPMVLTTVGHEDKYNRTMQGSIS